MPVNRSFLEGSLGIVRSFRVGFFGIGAIRLPRLRQRVCAETESLSLMFARACAGNSLTKEIGSLYNAIVNQTARRSKKDIKVAGRNALNQNGQATGAHLRVWVSELELNIYYTHLYYNLLNIEILIMQLVYIIFRMI